MLWPSIVIAAANKRQAGQYEPTAGLNQREDTEGCPENGCQGGEGLKGELHGAGGSEPVPADTGSLFVFGLIRCGEFAAFRRRPHPRRLTRGWMSSSRGISFPIPGNLSFSRRTRPLYYANNVYVNSVDINRPYRKHSWSARYRFWLTSGVGTTYSGTANVARIFPGILRRQMRRAPDIHGHDRARRKQFEFSKHC